MQTQVSWRWGMSASRVFRGYRVMKAIARHALIALDARVTE